MTHCSTCRCHPRAARTARPRTVPVTLSLSAPIFQRASLEADRRGMTVGKRSSEALEVLLVELGPVAGNGTTTTQAARRAALDRGRAVPR
jgi:hypothetical protein